MELNKVRTGYRRNIRIKTKWKLYEKFHNTKLDCGECMARHATTCGKFIDGMGICPRFHLKKKIKQ